MAITIEPIDTATASESLLRELHEYYIRHDADRHPGDPPMPWEQRLGIWRNQSSPHLKVARWILRDDGAIVAAAVLALDQKENEHIGFARIHVLPEHRRRGLATRLAEPILAALQDEGRTLVVTDTADAAPWGPRLEALGMAKAFQGRHSRLLVEDIDWGLMDEWIERASERATDYELKYVTVPIAEEDIHRWCHVMAIMNTAPREDLDFDDFTMTPEKWRDIEENIVGRAEQLAAFVAVHKATGDWVGMSEIIYAEAHPEQAQQGDTGVDPSHRNKGLGRWLKAAMIRRFMADHPDVVRIDTENADSNQPMLNINTEMGYRELKQETAWQGEVATIRERLGLR